MEAYFHWTGRKRPFFEGWYLKHQNKGRTIAFIPAFHVTKEGKRYASLQIITDDGAWYLPFEGQDMRAEKHRFRVKLGENVFSEKGVHLHLKTEGISVEGTIKYGPLHGLHTDIMGPFRYVPLLECSHGVLSMSHTLTGSLMVNGREIDFSGGAGYIETDRGNSFPKDYLWTQCSFEGTKRNSVMISAADIPLMGRVFKGCICAVHYGEEEYRIATYRGAVIRKCSKDEIWIQQGSMGIKASRLGECAFGLKAPQSGDMCRTIYENPSCKVRYRFYFEGRKLFDITGTQASFERVIG